MSRFMESKLAASGLDKLYRKIMDGRRLDFDDGRALYRTRDLTAVAFLANLVRERKSGDLTYFVRNLHINYTNICNKGCKFCSFYALPNDARAYVLSIQDVQDRIRKHGDVPIREIHMVAGINPRLPYQYYLELIRAVKETKPGVHVKAFTMIELAQIQRVAKKPMGEMLADLKSAGLDCCPGGGAEVFSDRVHEELFRAKLDNEGGSMWRGKSIGRASVRMRRCSMGTSRPWRRRSSTCSISATCRTRPKVSCALSRWRSIRPTPS